MRITKQEKESIVNIAKTHFGEDIQVYLFGSRTNEEGRGGDIDLFISGNRKEKLNLINKIKFLADLKLEIGEQKIDVVFDSEQTKSNSNFYHSIMQQKQVL